MVAGTKRSICSGVPCSRMVAPPTSRSPGPGAQPWPRPVPDRSAVARPGTRRARTAPASAAPAGRCPPAPPDVSPRATRPPRRPPPRSPVAGRPPRPGRRPSDDGHGLGQRRNPTQPAPGSTEEPTDSVGPAQIQMRVVLPGAADTTEHLDTVLGVGFGGVDADARGHRRGDRKLGAIGIGCGAGRIGGGHIGLLGTAQHLSTQCLTAWKLPIGLPNCSRTLA